MTQPGVSQHIQKLEQYYQTALLNRHGKQFELTPAGEQFYQFALNLLRNEQDLKEQLRSDNPYEGVCRLSSPGNFLTNLPTGSHFCAVPEFPFLHLTTWVEGRGCAFHKAFPHP